MTQDNLAPEVSLLLLTHDRYQMTKYCLENLLEKTIGVEFKLYILDNGSNDKRVRDYIDLYMSDNPPVKCKNMAHISITKSDKNIGIAAGFNYLLKKVDTPKVCFLTNDILVKEDWLLDLVHYNKQVDKSGLTSIYCEGDRGAFSPLLTQNDMFTHVWQPLNKVTSGISLINSSALELVGEFDETLGIYGREREQFAKRLNFLGLYNYYVPNQSSTHIGREMNDTSDYKKMKELELQKNANRFNTSITEMKKSNNFKL
jgi:GT2 family glycosyltransferase